MFLSAVLLALSIADPIETITLDNGIRVHLLPIEGSQQISIVSLVPYGLTTDGPDRAQWSHLIEHLLTTSTGPISDYGEVNAETMASSMHLDFARPAEHWEEGIDKQATWLAGPKLTQDDVDREVPRVVSEVENVDQQGLSAKFALAAWAQAAGFGRTEVEINAHLKLARADVINTYLRERLYANGLPSLAVAGRFERESLVGALQEKIGRLELPEGRPLEAPDDLEAPEQVHWDLGTGFHCLAWPISDEVAERPELLDVAKSIAFVALQQIPAPHRRPRSFSFVETRARAAGRPYLVAVTPLKDTSEATLAAAREHAEQVRSRLPKGVARTRGMASMQTSLLIQQLLSPAQAIAQANPNLPRSMLEADIAVKLAIEGASAPSGLPAKLEALQSLGEEDDALLVELFEPKACETLFILPRR